MLPGRLGGAGHLAGLLHLLDQGDVLGTAVSGFPVWEPAGFLGSSAWGLWVAALGVAVVLRTPARAGPVRGPQQDVPVSRPGPPPARSPARR